MNNTKKERLLKGLDEYYSKRTDLLNESNEPKSTIVINSINVTKINGTFADYAKSHGLININDIQWNG